MQFSAKIGWSAAGGMTLVAAVLAGLLWGRSQTTPTADAGLLKPWLQPLAVPQIDDSEQGKQQVAAEIAEIRERLNIRLFDESVWNGEADSNQKSQSANPIPLLSSLPFCSGRPKATPEQQERAKALMMMVTPRIIIQDEDEDKLLGNSTAPVEKSSDNSRDGSKSAPSTPEEAKTVKDALPKSDEVQNFGFFPGYVR